MTDIPTPPPATGSRAHERETLQAQDAGFPPGIARPTEARDGPATSASALSLRGDAETDAPAEVAIAHRGTSVVNAGVVISPTGRKLCTTLTYEAAQEVASAWNAAHV